LTSDSFFGLSPRPGEQATAMVAVPGVEPTWEMPVVVIRGRHDGPTLGLTAGVHAAEYVPIEALTRLTRTVDPESLHGTVVAVLIVNMPGFFEHSIYECPRDGKNLGNLFPGDPDGTPSQQATAFLAQELILKCDAYIDAHCGDMIEALAAFSLWPRVADQAVAGTCYGMAQAYGLERVLGMDPKNIPGLSYSWAASQGIPAIVGEVGQQGICDEPSVEQHLLGMRNAMAYLGMTGQEPLDLPTRNLQGLAWTRSSEAGTYHPTVAAGDQVVQGQKTGELRDLFGNTIEEHHASADGEIVFLVTALAVNQGGPLLGIAVNDPSQARNAGYD
jgi:uncharacterized protein